MATNTDHAVSEIDRSERRARIKELIRGIGNKKMKKHSKETVGSTDSRKKTYKLHMGWLHFREGKYKQVSAKKGGGNRTIDFNKDEAQSVHSFIELGKRLFFPGGKSQLGHISDMSVSLSNYTGEVIEQFKDREGNECSFQNYLKSNGVFSSQVYLYLRTHVKSYQEPTLERENIVKQEIQLQDVGQRAQPQNMQETQLQDVVQGVEPQNMQVTQLQDVVQGVEPQNMQVTQLQDVVQGIEPQNMQVTQLQDIVQGAEPQNMQVTRLRVVVQGSEPQNMKVTRLPDIMQGSEPQNIQMTGLQDVVQGVEPQSMQVTQLQDVVQGVESQNMQVTQLQDVVQGVESQNMKVTQLQDVVQGVESQNMKVTQLQDVVQGVESQNMKVTQLQDVVQGVESQNMQVTQLQDVVQGAVLQNMQVNPLHIVVQGVAEPQNMQVTQLQDVVQGVESQSMQVTRLQDAVQGAVLQNMQVNPLHIVVQGAAEPQNMQVIQLQDAIQRTESQLHTQMKTSPIFSVNGFLPGNMKLRYTKENTSRYSSQRSFLNCYSIDECWNMNFCDQEIEDGSYNPLNDGFSITSISVGDMTYLDVTEDKTLLPQKPILFNTQLFRHTPNELFGYEHSPNGRRLMMAVITANHNAGQFLSWFRDGQLFMSGINLCAIPISQPGRYTVGVSIHNSMFIHDPPVEVQVLYNNNDSVVAKESVDEEATPVVTETTSPVAKESVKEEATPVVTETISPVAKKSVKEEATPVVTETTSQVAKESVNEEAMPVVTETTIPKINLSDVCLEQEIGKGAFGVVTKGQWLGTSVAVKEIPVKRIKVVRKMVERELLINSKIRHPNIVQVMAYAFQHSNIYLITEFIDGNNLDNLLFEAEDVDFSNLQKKNISRQIVQSIVYLHNQCPPILHRDIKPENVIICKDLKVAKICDLGLSKINTMNTVITTLAGNSFQPGTTAYQAPEIVIDRKGATTMSDVWSLSCTMVELWSETTIWNYNESIGQDIHTYILSKMTKGCKPDGLETLLSTDTPAHILGAISNGLEYVASDRHSAWEMLSAFKE